MGKSKKSATDNFKDRIEKALTAPLNTKMKDLRRELKELQNPQKTVEESLGFAELFVKLNPFVLSASNIVKKGTYFLGRKKVEKIKLLEDTIKKSDETQCPAKDENSYTKFLNSLKKLVDSACEASDGRTKKTLESTHKLIEERLKDQKNNTDPDFSTKNSFKSLIKLTQNHLSKEMQKKTNSKNHQESQVSFKSFSCSI